ncbi:MAG: Gfo/Idh/MocA family oxidoreductase [Erysipelotrichaceae bacterium]|nr:Gfo/Idh/MocA family oxidoreductase [Erysipelotrichaceae bacterium]
MKIGILATGAITHSVVPTLLKMDEIECYAVASRTLEKAEDFKNQYGFSKAYGSYEAMLKDPEVELVYVASPHSHHYEHMMLCIDHNKPVICEKAFTLNARQAKVIKEYAQKKNVFVTEAIWTRYMPSRKIIEDVLKEDLIGKIKTLTANLYYNVGHRERLSDPRLAGGALLDVGVYCVNFASMFFGYDIERIETSAHMTESGVDGDNSITIYYKDGRSAVLTDGIFARSDRKGIFYGEKGYIIVENINNPQSISVYDDNDVLLKNYVVPSQISGYEYEFEECVKAINEGRIESYSMPLDETVKILEIMDTVREKWGFRYPME